LKQALSIADRTLRDHGIRGNVSLFASGKIATPADVATAMALGADAVGFARGFLLAVGCIQSPKCHVGDCPAGNCTQSERAQKAIDVEAVSDRVATFAKTLSKETQMLAASCGYADPCQFTTGDAMICVEPGRWVHLAELAAPAHPAQPSAKAYGRRPSGNAHPERASRRGDREPVGPRMRHAWGCFSWKSTTVFTSGEAWDEH
jgi:hypothetical protein